MTISLEARGGVADYAGDEGTVGTSTAPTLDWREVDTGFWVASSGGNFCGTVERTGRRRYDARDAMGVALGDFTDAASAQLAVEEHVVLHEGK